MKTKKIGPLTSTNRAIGLVAGEPVVTRVLSLTPLSSGSRLIHDSTSANDVILVMGREFTTRNIFLYAITVSYPKDLPEVYGTMLASGGNTTRKIRYKIDGNRVRIWVTLALNANVISLGGRILLSEPDSVPEDAIAL